MLTPLQRLLVYVRPRDFYIPSMVFDLKQVDIQNKVLGSFDAPHLYHISSGKRSGKSLVFHIKIKDKYYELHIKHTYAKFSTLSCATRGCKATHRFSVVKELLNRDKRDSRNYVIFQIDRTNPDARNINNWTVIKYTTVPHSCKGNSIFRHIARDVREAHTLLSIKSGVNEYDSLIRKQFFCRLHH